MSALAPLPSPVPELGPQARRIFDRLRLESARRCDRIFAWLMVVQWGVGIALAAGLSPYAWHGQRATVHEHVWLAVLLGGAISLPAIAMARRLQGARVTRHVIAVAQVMWSALLIHLTGGRIETHFHIFGSLAFLAFYRDSSVILTATVLVAADHATRGILAPQAIYGIPNPEWWRFLEHSAWIVFEDIVLMLGIRQSTLEMRLLAVKQDELATSNERVEQRVRERTAALATSQTRYRSLVESIQAVPFELQLTDLAVTYVGPQAEALLGTRPESWLAAGFLAGRTHTDDVARVREACTKCLADGCEGELEFRLRHDTGKWIWVRGLLSGTAGLDPDTRQGILLDVTQRRLLEEELRAAQKLESVGRLAAGVAHEINTPTQFIGDNIRFLGEAFQAMDRLVVAGKALAEATDPALRERAVEDMQAAYGGANFAFLAAECPLAIRQSLDGVDRVAKIVHAMKDFAHVDQPEKVPVDINRVITGAITVCRNEWKYVADVVAELDPTNPSLVGYAGDLGQVVINLVVNAAHAIAEIGDQVHRRIHVRTRVEATDVVLEVEDEGAGIPEAVQGRIFEQFFTTKPVGKGTGQGLALAHRIVTGKHGGQMSFTSKVGVGTRFTMRLPVHPAAVVAEA